MGALSSAWLFWAPKADNLACNCCLSSCCSFRCHLSLYHLNPPPIFGKLVMNHLLARPSRHNCSEASLFTDLFFCHHRGYLPPAFGFCPIWLGYYSYLFYELGLDHHYHRFESSFHFLHWFDSPNFLNQIDQTSAVSFSSCLGWTSNWAVSIHQNQCLFLLALKHQRRPQAIQDHTSCISQLSWDLQSPILAPRWLWSKSSPFHWVSNPSRIWQYSDLERTDGFLFGWRRIPSSDLWACFGTLGIGRWWPFLLCGSEFGPRSF